jgi:hypothetical protein
MEHLNSEHHLNEMKQAYLVINDDSMCKVCNKELKHKTLRIFPNGGAYHQKCTKDPCECPVTRERFDAGSYSAYKKNSAKK